MLLSCCLKYFHFDLASDNLKIMCLGVVICIYPFCNSFCHFNMSIHVFFLIWEFLIHLFSYILNFYSLFLLNFSSYICWTVLCVLEISWAFYFSSFFSFLSAWIFKIDQSPDLLILSSPCWNLLLKLSSYFFPHEDQMK